MTVTKEQVLERAKEVGVTLTDAEVDQYVASGKLPEKQETRTGSSVEELIGKYTPRQLAEMLVDTRGEAKDRRLEAKKLKEDAEALSREIGTLRESVAKHPELESKMKAINDQLQAIKDAEKKRREAVFSKLTDEDKLAFASDLDPDKVTADAFDARMGRLLQPKNGGSGAPPPNGEPTGAPNPWKKETRNLTLQAKMMREDPATAIKLKQAAGVA